jgi:hypothetical protein
MRGTFRRRNTWRPGSAESVAYEMDHFLTDRRRSTRPNRCGKYLRFHGAPITRATTGGGLRTPTPGISLMVAVGSGTLSCGVPVGAGSGNVKLYGCGRDTGLSAGSGVENSLPPTCMLADASRLPRRSKEQRYSLPKRSMRMSAIFFGHPPISRPPAIAASLST